jgi:DNA-directed RNA polymerase sigma subunit (sigma70/sigma32)
MIYTISRHYDTEILKTFLTNREYIVFVSRYLNNFPPTRKDLAERFSVTQTRIKQIEEKAVKKLFNKINGDLKPLEKIVREDIEI